MKRLQPGAAALLDQLESIESAVGVAMAAAIIREVAPIRTVSQHDPDFQARFAAFCEQHVQTFISTTRGGRLARPADLAFVRVVAERRADDAFPLPALMEGLRIGHRVLNHQISQLGAHLALDASDVLWATTRLIDYMDAAGAELGEAYRARQVWSAGRGELARREILDDLLEGRYASRPDAAYVAASLGFEPDEQYIVAVLVPARGSEQRTQPLAAEVTRAAAAAFRFVVARGEEVVSVSRYVDAHRVVEHAIETFSARFHGGQARAGLSSRCRGIGEVGRGYWEAVRAIRFTSDQEPVVDLTRLGPLRYLEFNADSVARQLAAEYLCGLKPAADLAETVLVYVDSGLSARTTAQRLGVHLNTVHNRLERVAELLQRPRLGPVELLEAATAIRICRNKEYL